MKRERLATELTSLVSTQIRTRILGECVPLWLLLFIRAPALPSVLVPRQVLILG